MFIRVEIHCHSSSFFFFSFFNFLFYFLFPFFLFPSFLTPFYLFFIPSFSFPLILPTRFDRFLRTRFAGSRALSRCFGDLQVRASQRRKDKEVIWTQSRCHRNLNNWLSSWRPSRRKPSLRRAEDGKFGKDDRQKWSNRRGNLRRRNATLWQACNAPGYSFDCTVYIRTVSLIRWTA